MWNIEQFQKDQELLPVSAPPCPGCAYWHPVNRYVSYGMYFAKWDGIRLCHAQEMERDFSCFREKQK